jgi:hypothetical protein
MSVPESRADRIRRKLAEWTAFRNPRPKRATVVWRGAERAPFRSADRSE